MISLHPTIVVLSLSWINEPPHKMELSGHFWDLYVTFTVVKFYDQWKEFCFLGKKHGT